MRLERMHDTKTTLIGIGVALMLSVIFLALVQKGEISVPAYSATTSAAYLP